MRLLIVEDEIDLATALATGLRREGYAVDTAATAAEARERLADVAWTSGCPTAMVARSVESCAPASSGSRERRRRAS
jgi:DNA-binding response OmpR family regulator